MPKTETQTDVIFSTPYAEISLIKLQPGQSARVKGETTTAIASFTLLLNELKVAGILGKPVTDVLVELGYAYLEAVGTDLTPNATVSFMRALQQAHRSEDKEAILAASAGLVLGSLKNGTGGQALDLYKTKLLNLLEEEVPQNDLNRMRAFRALGQEAFVYGSPDKAENYFNQALGKTEGFSHANLTPVVGFEYAQILVERAKIHEIRQNSTAVVGDLTQAFNLFVGCENYSKQAQTAFRFYDYYLGSGNLTDATNWFQKAQALVENNEFEGREYIASLIANSAVHSGPHPDKEMASPRN